MQLVHRYKMKTRYSYFQYEPVLLFLILFVRSFGPKARDILICFNDVFVGGRQATVIGIGTYSEREPNMNIDYLADYPEFIPLLARQMAEHWRDIIPGEDSWRRFAALNSHKNRDQLPMAWVAHEDGQPFGTCALRKCDLEGWEKLTPWLAGVFVMPHSRGQGVAKELCRVAENKAWAWGAPRLYLHTPDQQGLYRSLGWEKLKLADWNGVETTIMVKEQTNVSLKQL